MHDQDWEPDADVFSPDRCVRLLAKSSGELGVEVQNLHRHTEQTLAGQIRAAARLALASLQKSSTAVVTEPDPVDDGRRRGTWR